MKINNGLLVVGNIKKLFRGFYNVLANKNFDLVVHVNYVLLDYLKNYDPDFEIQFATLMPMLSINLGSDKYAIHNSTLKVLKSYIRAS